MEQTTPKTADRPVRPGMQPRGDHTRLRDLLPGGGESGTDYVAGERGLVVVDGSLNLIAFNTHAIRILAFPEPASDIQQPDVWLASNIRARLVERHNGSQTSFVKEFPSARRTYSCSFCFLNITNGRCPNPPAVGLTLDRKSNGALTMATLSERFGLTRREQETVKLLLQGLTSKEIAARMDISPNTVKAFVRLVMIKMGVSTRSGIAGKIVASDARA